MTEALVALITMNTYLEIWADSFHEGRWVATELGSRFDGFEVQYERGFIPLFTLRDATTTVTIRVFGDYEAWSGIPEAVANVLTFGKSDFVLYAPDEDRVLFVGEETAAVPTGNQSTQRCERMIGMCLQDPPIPFAYLLPEYGLHIDGQPRRASVWPAMLAAKLADQHDTTSLVLLYGDQTHPEDYSVGEGPGLLFDLLATYVREHARQAPALWKQRRAELLARARATMQTFVVSQAPNMLRVLPDYCSGAASLDWPAASAVTNEGCFSIPRMLREDAFLSAVYAQVGSRRAYTLIPGSGSKPQLLSSLRSYTSEHTRAIRRHHFQPDQYQGYNLDPAGFPQSPNGNFHVTSSPDITFLFDCGEAFVECFREAFPDREAAKERLESQIGNDPVFLYTSASMKKGRVFGDPYAGQFACFSKILAYDHTNRKQRKVVAYFPLQSYAAFPNIRSGWNTSKGLRLYKELVDVVICQGGVLALLGEEDLV